MALHYRQPITFYGFLFIFTPLFFCLRVALLLPAFVFHYSILCTVLFHIPSVRSTIAEQFSQHLQFSAASFFICILILERRCVFFTFDHFALGLISHAQSTQCTNTIIPLGVGCVIILTFDRFVVQFSFVLFFHHMTLFIDLSHILRLYIVICILSASGDASIHSSIRTQAWELIIYTCVVFFLFLLFCNILHMRLIFMRHSCLLSPDPWA